MAEHDSLTDEQRARLAALRRAGSRRALPAEPDEPAEQSGRIPATGRTVGPMSASQERIWFLDRFLPDSIAYHIAGSYRLLGEVSLPALRRTVHALVERHPAFRTRFEMVADVPSQIVHDTAEVTVREATSETDDPAELAAITDAFVRERFDLARGPLLRFLLTRTGPNEAVLTIVVHHIVFDGWSLGVFMGEFAALYREQLDGTPSRLADVPITYLDYAIWQRERETGQEFEAQRKYWTNLLADIPTVLELPTDHARPAVQTFAGARHRFTLSNELRGAVERLAREHATTPYVVLLTGFAILLHRWSSEPRFGCATPVANRPRLETENVIGFFVNTLVLPMDLTGEPTFAEVLRRVSDTWFGSFGQQEYPFEQLVDAMGSDRVLSHNPLAQVMFILQSAPANDLELAGVRLESVTTDTATTKFDLTLELFPEEHGYDGAVEYATDLFDPSTIERFVARYVRLLEAMLADPDGRVTTAPLTTEAEAEQLAAWHATAADTGLPARITDRIAAETGRSADRIAVRTGEVELSYRELGDRSGRIANLLRSHEAGEPVGPDRLVGLCLRRGPELVPALLGTLVAGGAYVPFDPDQPAERIGTLVADGGIDVLLTTTDCLPALRALPAGVTTIVLDDPTVLDTLADQPPDWPAPDGTHGSDRDLAYVIHTSGSTGEPKGVMIEHRSILNRIAWMQAEYGLTPGDRVLQKTAYTFDVSVWEFLWPLSEGATVVLASPDAPREPTELAREIREHRITHLHFVPTALAAFLRVETLADTAVRRIFCSGDVLSRELCERTHADCGIAIDNLYGPTECAVDVTYWRWHPDSVGRPPIGQPVANTRAHVVDEAGNELPVGIPGELWIGGVQVGRGYLGRDDLTAERFLPDPFDTAGPGDRVYRTGDLVRRRSDGLLEFLGRVDDQVKVRGFRIEPGEIEAALRREPEVADAAVVCCEDAGGDRRLVGYVVADHANLDLTERADRVGEWTEVFDRTYADDEPVSDPALNLKGWTSAVAREPIPETEMAAWVDSTVERIAATGARSFLEIGCGTGLLALRLAPDADHYLGLDVSRAGLDYLAEQVEARGLTGVELREAAAHEIAALKDEGQRFDCVVINSVVQYFPDDAYLENVLTTAARLLNPDGALFVGDVQHLGLARHFRMMVARHHDPDGEEDLLAIQAAQRAAEERELRIDPSYFTGLVDRVPALRSAVSMVKAGRYDNEIATYRYDVLLSTRAPTTEVTRSLDWADVGSLSALADRLDTDETLLDGTLAVDGIPNARLAAVSGQRWASPEAHRGEPEIRPDPVHPDDLTELADRLGVRVQVVWSPRDADGRLAAVFHRRDARPWVRYPERTPRTTEPRVGAALHALPDLLRRRLRDQLPDYLVPSVLLPLPGFPSSTSGKVDRATLVRLAASRRLGFAVSDGQTPPRTDTERLVADAFGDVLNLPFVAVEDNFFDLGGDSIKSIRVAARLRESGYSVMIRSIFAHQTVARLAEFLDTEVLRGPEAVPGEEPRETAAPSGPEAPLPASPLQRHMLRRLPGRGSAGVFTVQRVLRYRGDLDPEVAARAWHATVAATPILRYGLVATDTDGPVQRPGHVPDGEITVRDWSNEPDAEQRLLELLEADRDAGFDPASDPPARFAFLKLGPDHGCWVISLDYRRLDGWSLTSYLGRFLAAYQRVANPSDERSEEPPVQEFDYRRYVAWRDERLADGSVTDWWRRRVRDLAHLPVTPTRNLHHRDFNVVTVSLTQADMRRFTETCRRAGVTAAVGFQALWGAVQCRQDRRERPQFGVMTSGRAADVPGIDTAIGMFMNSLPVTWETSEDDNVRTWLSEASAALLDLLERDLIGLPELDRMAGVGGDTGLFDSYLIFQNAPGVVVPDAERAFEVVDEASVAYAQQEHRLRVDIFPGSAQLVLSGYEPVERLRAYLAALRDAAIGLGSIPTVLRGSMRALLDHRPTEADPVVTAESLISAMVADEPFGGGQA